MHPLDRSNALLTVLVAVLALSLGLTRPKADTRPPLTIWDTSQVNEIRLYEGEQLKWSLLRDADGWIMAHPDITPAHNERVNTLLSLTATPSLQRWPMSDDKASEYGLSRPGYRLMLDDASIDFGTTAPISGLRYVGVEGQVHLIGDGYYHHLLAAPPAFHRPPPDA